MKNLCVQVFFTILISFSFAYPVNEAESENVPKNLEDEYITSTESASIDSGTAADNFEYATTSSSIISAKPVEEEARQATLEQQEEIYQYFGPYALYNVPNQDDSIGNRYANDQEDYEDTQEKIAVVYSAPYSVTSEDVLKKSPLLLPVATNDELITDDVEYSAPYSIQVPYDWSKEPLLRHIRYAILPPAVPVVRTVRELPMVSANVNEFDGSNWLHYYTYRYIV